MGSQREEVKRTHTRTWVARTHSRRVRASALSESKVAVCKCAPRRVRACNPRASAHALLRVGARACVRAGVGQGHCARAVCLSITLLKCACVNTRWHLTPCARVQRSSLRVYETTSTLSSIITQNKFLALVSIFSYCSLISYSLCTFTITSLIFFTLARRVLITCEFYSRAKWLCPKLFKECMCSCVLRE